MNFRTLTAAAVVAFAPVAVNAATLIDFTGTDYVFSASEAVATFSGGQTLTVTSVPPNALTQTAYDGTGTAASDAGLDLVYDGLGIRDDEATFPSEYFELVFNEVTTVTGIYVLDLFVGNADNFESVLVWFGSREDGEVADLVLTATQPTFENGGFAYLPFSFTGTSLVLGPGRGNDFAGSPDFALAAVEVIPLPASALLLLGGLGGLAAFKRRKSA